MLIDSGIENKKSEEKIWQTAKSVVYCIYTKLS